MKFLQIEKLCFQQAEEILGNRWPCEKFSVNSPTVIKNDVVERLEKQPLLFLQYTITTVICQVPSKAPYRWGIRFSACSDGDSRC